MPPISVIIPNYNHGKFLPALLDRLLAQSVQPAEIVVVDDGSTDNSMEVLNAYRARTPLLRVFCHETNRGVTETCNRCIRETTTDYFMGIAADDIPFPGFIEKGCECAARYPNAGICMSLPCSVNEETGERHIDDLGWSPTLRFFAPDEVADILGGHHIPTAGSVVRKGPFLDAGGFMAPHRWHSDWFYALVVAFRHGLCYLPEPLTGNRVCKGSYSRSGRRNRADQVEVCRALLRSACAEKFRDVLPLLIRSRAYLHLEQEALEAIATAPDLCRTEALLLVQQNLWNSCREFHARRDTQRQAQQQIEALRLRIAHLELAQAKETLARGEQQEAIQAMGKIVAELPGWPDGYLALASALRTCGQQAAAETILSSAAKVFPGHPAILHALQELRPA